MSAVRGLCPLPSPALSGLQIAGLAVILANFEEMTMATLGMAFSVLEHAEQFSAIGRWHAIADFWTAEEILEQLNSVEEQTLTPFRLDAGAICHFDTLLHPDLQRCGWR